MPTKKVTRATASSKITVKVGRFGEPTAEIKVCKGSCVESVLNNLNISVGEGQLYVNGAKAHTDQELKSGDTILVIGKKQGGSDEEDEETTD